MDPAGLPQGKTYYWIDESDALHFDLPLMLAELGLPNTPENLAELQASVAELLRKETPRATLIFQE